MFMLRITAKGGNPLPKFNVGGGGLTWNPWGLEL